MPAPRINQDQPPEGYAFCGHPNCRRYRPAAMFGHSKSCSRHRPDLALPPKETYNEVLIRLTAWTQSGSRDFEALVETAGLLEARTEEATMMSLGRKARKAARVAESTKWRDAKEKMQGVSELVRSATGYFFKLKDVTKGKKHHATYRLVCAQAEKSTKTSTVEPKRHRRGMERYACAGAALVHILHDDEFVFFSLSHGNSHPCYVDIELSPAITDYIKTEKNRSPREIYDDLRTKYPTATFQPHQIYTRHVEENQAAWRRDPDAMQSAKLLLESFGQTGDILPISFDQTRAPNVSMTGFLFEDIIDLIRRNSSAAAVDATYKTNSANLELVALMLELEGVGYPVGYLLMSATEKLDEGEKTEALIMFFEAAKAALVNPRVLLTDKDLCEINAARRVFDAALQLCLWHVLKAVRTRLAKTNAPRPYNGKAAALVFPFIDPRFRPPTATAHDAKSPCRPSNVKPATREPPTGPPISAQEASSIQSPSPPSPTSSNSTAAPPTGTHCQSTSTSSSAITAAIPPSTASKMAPKTATESTRTSRRNPCLVLLCDGALIAANDPEAGKVEELGRGRRARDEVVYLKEKITSEGNPPVVKKRRGRPRKVLVQLSEGEEPQEAENAPVASSVGRRIQKSAAALEPTTKKKKNATHRVDAELVVEDEDSQVEDEDKALNEHRPAGAAKEDDEGARSSAAKGKARLKKRAGAVDFCPFDDRPFVLETIEIQFNQHTSIPFENEDGTFSTLNATEIHERAVRTLYEYCNSQERYLPYLWAYLWNQWYQPAQWALWARSASDFLPTLRTTMLVEAHWKQLKHYWLRNTPHPRTDHLIHILITRVKPHFLRKFHNLL
ncbi:hypothetical protein P7C70_g7366, partial [Phenoliferia sp. Uapishka_3]